MKAALEACFIMVMRGLAENDGYNALVMAAGLQWRDVALVRDDLALPASDPRALFAGLHVGDAAQARGARGEDRRSVPRAVRSAAFVARRAAGGDRAGDRGRGLGRSRCSTRTASSAISSTRCSRRSAPTIISSATTASRSSEIAIKFSSRKLDGVPRPAPLYEIFVYSPRVEGVHMRFGKVARGGIRWSDRPQDFRTEVLGLVKAQQVKNAVIVPVGSKGGYVPKRLPVGGPREAIQAEGTAAYKIFISTLLDITDNLDLKKCCRPTTWCGTTTTILISSSPPTRAPRPSPISPTAFPRSTSSGSAMPSPPAARPATTTRAWASPRAARGSR